MNNFLVSNSSKKNSKLSRVKPIKRNSESASMRDPDNYSQRWLSVFCSWITLGY